MATFTSCLQCPPAPLLAPLTEQSYEHRQGRKLLADMECAVSFVHVQRFNDPMLVQVLEAMRTASGNRPAIEQRQGLV